MANRSDGGERTVGEKRETMLSEPRTIPVEPASVKIEPQIIGVVIESPASASPGRRVAAKPASGGASESSVEEDGSFSARLVGHLDRGRSGEGRALKVLVQAMRAAGMEVERVGGARDERGEDARLRIGTREVIVQCVSLPVQPGSWRELSGQGEARLSGTSNDAVLLVREALLHKARKAKDVLLVLDMAQIGALVSPALVRNYRAAFQDPASEFGFEQVWLVGPTTGSSQRLSDLY